MTDYLEDLDPQTFEVEEYLASLDERHGLPEGSAARLLVEPKGRRSLTRLDPLLFGILYFPHHICLRPEGSDDNEDIDPDAKGPITLTEFHAKACRVARQWVDGKRHRDAFVAPRGVGKSTWMFLIIPMWALAHRHRRFSVAFADNSNQAMQHLITFKTELDTNPMIRKDYPGLCEAKRRSSGASVADRRDLYVSKNDQAFRAAGIDSSNLGLKVGNQRPDLIIFDDVEPDESNYCVAADELVLTDDLRWEPAGSLRPGDGLYALDESAAGGQSRNGRSFRKAAVTANQVRLMQAVRVTLANGDTIVCTPEHPLLAARVNEKGKKWGDTRWVQAKDLHSDLGVAKVFDTWQQDTSRDAGWLAGIFDGEGSFTGNGGRQSAPYRLSVAQKEGVVLDKLRALLDERGVQYTDTPQASGVRVLWFRGGYPALLKLLGELRPERLIGKLGEPRAVQTMEWSRVVGVEPAGEVPMAVMGTSTKTFFANGYASHNSDYQKDQRLATIVNAVFPMNLKAAIVFTGTVLMPGSIMHDLVKVAMANWGDAMVRVAGVPDEPPSRLDDDWPAWVEEQSIRPHYYPALWWDDDDNPVSIWPRRWPVEEWLEGDPVPTYRTPAFQMAMQNNPRGRDDGWWTDETFVHGPLDPRPTRWILQIDPAVTDHKKSDYTGLVVAGYSPPRKRTPGRVEIAYADRVKLIGGPLRTRILKILNWYPQVKAVFIESNVGGDMWRQTLHGLPVPLYTRHSALPKEVRIAKALDWYQRPGKRVVHSGVCSKLELDMIAYPKIKHDDLVDAACLAVLRFLGTEQRKRLGVRSASYL